MNKLREVPRTFWIAAAVLVSAVVVALTLGSEAAVREIGLVLQLLGLLTTAYGLVQLRREFGRSDIWSVVLSWVQYPRPRQVSASASSTIEFRTEVKIDHWDPKETLDFEWVRRFVKTELEEPKEAFHKSMKFEREILYRTVEEIREKLERALLSGEGVTFMGLAWVGVGIIMSTIPNELLCLLSQPPVPLVIHLRTS